LETGNSGLSGLDGVGVTGVLLKARFEGFGYVMWAGEAGRLMKELRVGVIGVLDGLGPGSTGSTGNSMGGCNSLV